MTSKIELLDHERLRIQINVEANWGIVFTSGLWLIFFMVGFGWLAYGFIYYPNRIGFDFIILMLGVSGLFMVVVFMSNLGRTETIILDNNHIQIKKTGGLGTSSQYELSSVSKFYYDSEDKLPTWMKFWGLDSGKVCFDYIDTPKRFGKRLSNQEALQIVDEINLFRLSHQGK